MSARAIFRNMTLVKFLLCPLCSLSRPLRSEKRLQQGKSEVATFKELEQIENMVLVQYREVGGKVSGSGKRGRGKAPGLIRVLDGGLTLQEMMQHSEYAEILKDLKSQFLRLQEGFRRIGFL